MTITTGTKLGWYEILAGIGAGGMGEVYRARDGKLGRYVAIKVLPTDKNRFSRQAAFRDQSSANLLPGQKVTMPP
jgi:eukaryotic-like serine/threonine-protein kinase